MVLTAGTRLGPYEIEGMLGGGGMGEVYKARDTRLHRTVAVKVLAPEIASDAAFKARFEREARTLSTLNHPHICVLHDIGAHNGIDYLVLEHLEGQTLAERLQAESGGLKLADALRIAVAVADALDAAHRHGIIHRDVKPGNIILTPGGPKLLDFGLAKQPSATSAAASTLATQPGTGTSQGVIVGTLQYMAPEQIQGQQVDARTDVFAFGAVLYEMVTGRKPFEGQSQASLIAKILEVEPPTLPVSSPALDHLVRQCLAKNPNDRWQTARDLLLELRWVQENDAKRESMTPQPKLARRWLPWAVAAAASLAAGSSWALRPAVTEFSGPPVHFDVPIPPKMQPPGEWQGAASLSPDGRYLAVAASLEGRMQILLRRMDDTAFQPLAGTDDARVPFWSPDSRSIAFFANGKLRRIAATGGAAVTICEAGELSYGGSWSKAGLIIFSMSGVIHKVAASGGVPVAVTSIDATQGDGEHRYPLFLPDGQSFLFTVLGRQPGIRVGVLGTQTNKLLVPDGGQAVFVPPSSLIFVREQSVMALPFDPQRLEVTGQEQKVADRATGGLSATTGGTLVFRPAGVSVSQLQWFARDGRRLRSVGVPGGYQQMALSPSGRRVALQRGEAFTTLVGTDIWMIDLMTGVLSRVTSDPGFEGDPSWSPDERSLAFTTRRTGRLSLFKKDLSTGIEAPLVQLAFDATLDEWTPDGRFVMFRNLGRAIQALPLVGDRTPRIIVDTPLAIEDQVHVSPNGRWIAFNSNESGRWEVYVASFPDFLGKRQISTGGGLQPVWRSNSEELFYLDPLGQLMMVAVSDANSEFGVARPLFQTMINPSPHYGEYGVAPDGQTFLLIEPAGPTPAAFTFVVNWRLHLQ